MTEPAPRLNPVPSPGGSLLRQFATMLLLLISLAVSLTFLFVQTPTTQTADRHATLVLVWQGLRPDMISATLTPHLMALGASGVIALDHHAAIAVNAPDIVTATGTPAASATPSATGTPSAATVTPTTPPHARATPEPTVTPSPTLTPSPTAVPIAPPSADATTPIPQFATLAQAAQAQGIGVSYEGVGATSLAETLGNIRNTYLFDTSSVIPAPLDTQIQEAGLSPPLAGTDRGHYYTQSYLKVMLPALRATNSPFLSVIVYDAIPNAVALHGLGSPAFLTALQANDAALGDIVNGLRSQGLLDTTNIIVTSDTGVSGVLAPGASSAASQTYMTPTPDVRTDIAARLQAAVAQDTSGNFQQLGAHGVSATTVDDATTVFITAQGGQDAIVIPDTVAVRALGAGSLLTGQQFVANLLVPWLAAQPEVGPLFVNDMLGKPDGSLPMSALGSNTTIAPAIIFGFTTYPLDVPDRAANSLSYAGTAYADTDALGVTNTLSRRDLHTVLYAQGPNFKGNGVRDLAPTGSIDLALTIAHILQVTLPKGTNGRTIAEILVDGADVADTTATDTLASEVVYASDHHSAFLVLLDTEIFQGVTYVQDAFGIHGDGSAARQDLIDQAKKLAGQE